MNMQTGESQQIDVTAAVQEIGESLGFSDNTGADYDTTSDDITSNESSETDGPTGSPKSADLFADADADSASTAFDAQTSDSAATSEPAASDDAAAAESGRRPAADPTAPPKSWKAGPSAKWAVLDPEVRAEIHRREQDFFSGIEGYKEAATVGRDFHQVMQPFLPVLQQHGLDPYQQVAGLMQAHQTLALGTQAQKQALFKQLVADYQVDLTDLVQDAGETPYVDPEVARLRQETEALQSTVAQMNASQRATRAGELQAQITKFSTDPKNVYFNELASDMAVLIKSGVCQTLEQAYDKALWTNPTVRAKELARQTVSKEEVARKTAKEKADAAKKAAAVNTPVGKPGSRAAPAETMDDTMASTLAAIKARG